MPNIWINEDNHHFYGCHPPEDMTPEGVDRLCPICSREIRIVALIDEREVLERILRHLGLWEQGIRVHSGADPPPECTIEPWLEDPFPDYDTEPVLTYAKS
jgi:hypothetical protein